MGRISVATIDSPEFINVTSISPLISKCEIKVLYVGGNRNRSYISKEVATEMAQTLPGCPIVGYYIESKEDFGDHGDQMIIDGEGVKFKKLTKPYGFVAPNSRIWFQKFNDTDEFGNTVTREYLMTEGYLWTGQFPECKCAVEGKGKPHSMELDEDTLQGYWTNEGNSKVDFFIINDAMFSKLCILGDDVEPCFEGSSVTAPEVSARFSKNENFNHTLYTMMEELKYELNKGGNQMAVVELQNEAVVEETAAPEVEENFSAEKDSVVEENTAEIQDNTETVVPTEEFKKCGEDEKPTKHENKKDDEEPEEKCDSNEEDKKSEDKCDEDDKKKFELLQKDFNELQDKYSLLEQSYNELVAFKKGIEDAQKDALIESFYMLSDDDKKDVIENKSQYSLDDIEAKLSIICVRKKVDFSLGNKEDKTEVEQPAVTFNLDSTVANELPAWLKAVEETKNRNN